MPLSLIELIHENCPRQFSTLSRIITNLDKAFRTLIEKVAGFSPAEVRVMVIDEIWVKGYKKQEKDFIAISDRQFVFGLLRETLKVLFHEVCHNISYKFCFNGDFVRYIDTYRYILKEKKYWGHDEEIICNVFGEKLADMLMDKEFVKRLRMIKADLMMAYSYAMDKDCVRVRKYLDRVLWETGELIRIAETEEYPRITRELIESICNRIYKALEELMERE